MKSKAKMHMGYGDAVKVAKDTGYCRGYVTMVFNGTRHNEEIRKAAKKILQQRLKQL